MNTKIKIAFLFALACGLLAAVRVIESRAVRHVEEASLLTLELRSDKLIYTLGEPVDLTFRLTNISENKLRLKQRPDVQMGYLSVWIAANDSSAYKPYRNTSWGLREGGGITIEPGEFFESTARVLRNSKPDLTRLNPDIAHQRITTDFAFPAEGVYYVKAILSVPGENTKIESAPIQLTFTTPTNDDLLVWNQIKDSSEIAFFLEQSDFVTSDKIKRERILQTIDELARKYPGALLVKQLTTCRESFDAKEMKRKAMLEKARVPNN